MQDNKKNEEFTLINALIGCFYIFFFWPFVFFAPETKAGKDPVLVPFLVIVWIFFLTSMLYKIAGASYVCS